MSIEVDNRKAEKVDFETQEAQAAKILTLREVAELLRVNQSTVSRYAKSGALKSHKIGSRRLFKETDVWSFFDNQVDRECVFGKER